MVKHRLSRMGTRRRDGSFQAGDTSYASGGAQVKTKTMAAVAAAMLALAGCDKISIGGGGDGGAGSAPPQIAAADLQGAVSDERVRRFYEARQWQPVWSQDADRALVEALRGAHAHAIDPRRLMREVDAAQGPAAREAALTLAALNYADALARGQTDPKRLFEVYELPRPEADTVGGLARAAQEGNVPQWLAGLAPQDAEYRALSQAYLQYSEAGSREPPPAVTGGDSIKVGESDPRMPAIVRSLRMQGYLPPEGQPAQGQGQGQGAGQGNAQGNAQAPAKQAARPADSTRYTPEIAVAVRRVQQDYGLETDGVIGGATLDIVNATARDRARQLAVNLERRRWLARSAPETRIDVNTAAAFLDYWRDGNLADSRKVMVGQPDWETPSLQSPIVRLVANPPWNVPDSIEEDELANRSAAYLAQNGFERRNGRLVQKPGPESALGLVKMDMSNRHAIYLHDTPSKPGFARAERHVSHGCVRVHDAVGFAAMLAEHDGKRPQFEQALARRDDEGAPRETSVQLSRQIPVRLLYHSVYLDRGGRLLFRSDPYGWDETVAQALGLAARQRQSVRRHAGDIGP
jgi:murein L,D-transpeptidase YcbB/YkuD